METIIAERKEVFNDFRIPWDEAIERKFYARMAAFPNCDPAVALDTIAKPYLEWAFEHPAETFAEWLKEKHHDQSISGYAIKREIGEDNFALLVDHGFIAKVKGTNKWELRRENKSES